MDEQIYTPKKTPRLFLSYASVDKKYAQRLAGELKKSGASVWFDEWELQIGDSLVKRIDDALAISDYLLILLTPNSVNSNWIQAEWKKALSNEINNRAITVIPVLLEDCIIPTDLAGRLYLDLRSNFQNGVTRLIEQLSLTPQVDFEDITEASLINILVDLLSELGFFDIQICHGLTEKGRDIEAHYRYKDPFGKETEEIWLIEAKLYKNGRADLRSISQMFQAIGTMSENYKGLIVTNGQVTSAARSWLENEKNSQRAEIRVIDGTELRGLLLRHPTIIRRYFGKKGES
jgi:hypothetical protein